MNTRALTHICHLVCRTSALLVLAALALPGCDAPAGAGGGGTLLSADGGGDAGSLGDAAGGDASQGTDTAVTPLDVLVPDTGAPDVVAVKDTEVPDVGPADTGPVDTGPVDTGPADTGPNCSKTDYTKVQTILTQNCNGCHGHQFGSSCGQATGSKSQIKSKVSGGSMPPGGFSNSADKALVLKWISDGAACTPAPGCP